MRKILLCLCFVFAVGLLFSACGKDDKKQNPNTPTEETTKKPDNYIPPGIPAEEAAEEEQAIESADNLEELAARESAEQGVPVTFTIVELRFGANTIQSGETNTPIIVNTNANYTFGFALRVNGGERDGMIIYHYIDSVGVTYGDNDFISSNSKITKAANGFSVSNEFYSDETADINVKIIYKGLSGDFRFSLKSNKERPTEPESPAAQTQVRTISEKTVNNITIKMELVLPPETENREWKIVGNEVWGLPEAFGHTDIEVGRIYVKLNIRGTNNDGDYYITENNKGTVIAVCGTPPFSDYEPLNNILGDYKGAMDIVMEPQTPQPKAGVTFTATYKTISIQGTTFNLMKDFKARIVSSL